MPYIPPPILKWSICCIRTKVPWLPCIKPSRKAESRRLSQTSRGIRKGALQRLGIEVKCYLGDPRTATMAAEKGLTRTQAGIRLAVEEHPDAFFVFGNAPTALMELCDLIRKGKAHPAGIVAAPVGFVHVQESKHMVKPFTEIPKIIVEGRKGGSNLAATLVNSVLCYNDAEQLRPGRDV